MRHVLHCGALLLGLWPGAVLCADEFENAPINYSQSAADNCVSRLQTLIERGEIKWEHQPALGYLPALLDALRVSTASQTLVFSKTSMQRHCISPATPRAVYFNDDVYVGFCQNGAVIEISVADPRLGAVFYTLDQQPAPRPRLVRQTESCLQCHGTSQTDGVPGHIVRSLFVDATGFPILTEGSRRVDHTTPVDQRWGGWYVTGQHGNQRHLGNLIVDNPDEPRSFVNDGGLNVTDLGRYFSTEDYLSPHSDIVALMVLEHQALVHNLITQANFAARQALHYEADLNRALGEPAHQRRDSTTSRIQSAGDKLVRALLFVDEAPLTAPLRGTSRFAEHFARSGPRDRQGRSLRDFDLRTRMFRHPCSYLIYSAAFDGLPPEMSDYVAEKIRGVLTLGDPDPAFARLSANDRAAIWEILTETKPELWPRAPARKGAL